MIAASFVGGRCAPVLVRFCSVSLQDNHYIISISVVVTQVFVAVDLVAAILLISIHETN